MLRGMKANPFSAVHRDPGRSRRKKGFTLIEVVMASFVMMFGILSAMITVQASFKMIDRARYTTLAGQILQSQMEKLRLLTWSQLTDPVNGPVAHPNFTPDISLASSSTAQINHFTPAGGGACTQTIADATAPSVCAGTMKDITLTATWVGSDGRRQALSYVTRYAQNGISDFFYTTH
jgi:Tfp pilus assembly protein PilV